ncbi:MAG: hypothetical protein IT201_01760 [Thermoleophilia bacterium]|nr:hypothetical protein [Thermoleophilia bacterium]
MRHVAPPSIRGPLPARWASLLAGLSLCSLGIVLLLESRLGLSPWDMLHQGIELTTPISFGAANVLVGVLVLLLAWALGSRPGVGTFANAILIGVFIDLLLRSEGIRSLAGLPLGARVGLLAAAILLFGVGSAFYIGAGLGAGPRDSLMLVTARRLGVRVGVSRASMELAALAAGAALGGQIGVGTVAFALLIGPSVELSVLALGRSPLALAGEAALGTAR